ncbi:uncharacterized protein LOC115448804 [Manduca sexta]|uniref:uncharacterized protein LOC115448804 n=1 Tax=Manduca sexta TaxID=7130 RepID=UPI00188E2D5E|nr:uncharacterized protein LOC115448804 [Manduca sexta]
MMVLASSKGKCQDSIRMHVVIFTASLFITAVPSLAREWQHQVKNTYKYGSVQAFESGSYLETVLQEFFSSLAEKGLDPYEPVDEQVIDYSLPDDSFILHAVLNGLRITGLSKIVINSITTGLVPPSFDFNMVFPELNISASTISAEIEISDKTYGVEGGGWIVLKNVTIIGRAEIMTSFEVVSARVTIGAVQSYFTGTLNDVNYTGDFNELVNVFLLPLLIDNNNEANDAVNELLIQLLNYIFSLS